MAQTLKVRRGDLVHVIRGKDRGKEGRVIAAMPKDGRVLVENINVVKRHQRPRPIQDSSRMGGPQIEPGGIIEKPAAMPVARVMLVCPTCGRPTRVGVEIRETKGEKRKVRICKRADCGQDIDR